MSFSSYWKNITGERTEENFSGKGTEENISGEGTILVKEIVSLKT